MHGIGSEKFFGHQYLTKQPSSRVSFRTLIKGAPQVAILVKFGTHDFQWKATVDCRLWKCSETERAAAEAYSGDMYLLFLICLSLILVTLTFLDIPAFGIY